MNETDIITEIRRLIREPSPVSVSNTDISNVIARGVSVLGLQIKEVAPSYHTKKAVLASETNLFSQPSDCISVRKVWDAQGTATAVTDATNASPINIEATANGLGDDDIVLVSGVLGNTAANGTWKVTDVDANNVTLNGSNGNAAYTSGGYIIKLLHNLTPITRKHSSGQCGTSRYEWYPQQSYIVVDYLNMSNDIIIDYIYRPTEVTDIPAEYHDGLIAYGVIRLMRMPDSQKTLEYADKRKVLDEQSAVLTEIKRMINSTFQVSSEPSLIENDIEWDNLGEGL